MQHCLCGQKQSYENCCGRLHRGEAVAETPEQLMRSRYSAFVLKNSDYLKQTWVAEQCPAELGLDEPVKWLRLEIIATHKGGKDDDEGRVEFKAWFIENEKLYCLHESSQFIKQDGRWLYQLGELFEEPVQALSRNQLCPCGSGKKYKRCCL